MLKPVLINVFKNEDGYSPSCFLPISVVEVLTGRPTDMKAGDNVKVVFTSFTSVSISKSMAAERCSNFCYVYELFIHHTCRWSIYLSVCTLTYLKHTLIDVDYCMTGLSEPTSKLQKTTAICWLHPVQSGYSEL